MLSFLRDFAVEKLGHLEANFILGGGNSIIFIFNLSWVDDPFWQAYFSDGLKPPTTVDGRNPAPPGM